MTMLIRERMIDVNGHRTRCLDTAGDWWSVRRPTVVLVPSMFLLARSYRPTLAALSKAGFRVVAPELPGTGVSSRLTTRWSFEDYAYWLVTAVEAMELDRPALIGHSVSGPVVMTAAARHGSRVGPIVVSDSAGALNGWSARMWSLIPRRLIDAIDELPFDLRAVPDALFNLAHHPRESMHQLRLARLPQVAMAQRVHVPTLLAWGAHDRTMPLRCVEALSERIGRATTYVSREGSHDWIIERPEEFAGAVRVFLDRCCCDPGSGEASTTAPYRLTGTDG